MEMENWLALSSFPGYIKSGANGPCIGDKCVFNYNINHRVTSWKGEAHNGHSNINTGFRNKEKSALVFTMSREPALKRFFLNQVFDILHTILFNQTCKK